MMPGSIQPMMALPTAALARDEDAFHYEYKWDGVRALTYFDGRRFRICSRNDNEITHRYPELSPLKTALSRTRVILDGEIIAIDEHNQPSFPMLQHRMHVEDVQVINRLAKANPVTYMLFDILYLNDRSTMTLPFVQRRQLLDALSLESDNWHVSPAVAGEGRAMLDSARQQSLEGIVAKRSSSLYEPGRRSGAWLKLKIIVRQEFVIGGWIPEGAGTSSRNNTARIGALLMGFHDRSGHLHLAGRVGTGFDRQWHERLTRELRGREQRVNPFAERVRSGVRFVRPEMVAEVEYRRWPQGGQIQQAAFKGIRQDKRPGEVVDERVEK